MFVIRKQFVLDALRWLKQYNVEYANIQIEESNLDWIENNIEQELPANLIQMDDNQDTKNMPASVDKGPCEMQTLSGLQGDLRHGCEIDSVLGILPSVAPYIPKEKDAQVVNTLNVGLKLHNKKGILQFSFLMLPQHQ